MTRRGMLSSRRSPEIIGGGLALHQRYLFLDGTSTNWGEESANPHLSVNVSVRNRRQRTWSNIPKSSISPFLRPSGRCFRTRRKLPALTLAPGPDLGEKSLDSELHMSLPTPILSLHMRPLNLSLPILMHPT